MPRIRLTLLGLVVLALLPAGCPLPADSTGPHYFGDSTSPDGDDTSSGGGGQTATSPETAHDSLSTRFPGCNELLQGDDWRDEILRLVNQERKKHDLTQLTWSPTLEAEATQYACEMISGGFFDHVNPDTGTHLADRAENFSYAYWVIGENLAAGQTTPEEAMTAWLDSPCHRQNILHPGFTELGVGIRYGGDYGYYWVQEFGRPFTAGHYDGPEYHEPGCDE